MWPLGQQESLAPGIGLMPSQGGGGLPSAGQSAKKIADGDAGRWVLRASRERSRRSAPVSGILLVRRADSGRAAAQHPVVAARRIRTARLLDALLALV